MTFFNSNYFASLLLIGVTLTSTLYAQESVESLRRQISEAEQKKNEIIQTDLAYTRITQEFENLIPKYEEQIKLVENATQRIPGIVEKTKSDMILAENWLKKSITQLNGSPDESAIVKIQDEYRRSYRNHSACRLEEYAIVLSDISRSINEMEIIKNVLLTTISANRGYAISDDFIDEAQKVVNDIIVEINKTQNLMNSLLSKHVPPNYCGLLKNFEVIVLYAKVSSSINKSIGALESISLKNFVEGMQTRENASAFIRDQRRILTGMRTHFLNIHRQSKLTESIESLPNFGDTVNLISKKIRNSDLISDSEKKELSTLITSAINSVEKDRDSYNLETIEGRRTMLISRSRRLQKELIALEEASKLKTELKSKAQTAARYALLEVNISTDTLVSVPQFSTLSSTVAFDSKLSKLEMLIRE